MLLKRKHKHPEKSALLEYAEGLIDSRARLDTEVASHVSQCHACQNRVDTIRAGLVVVSRVDAIDPSIDLTASILMAAKRAKAQPTAERQRSRIGRLAFSSGLTVAAILIWGVLQSSTVERVDSSNAGEAIVQQADALPMLNSIPSKVEQVLTEAIMGSHRSPKDDWARSQYRALNAYDDDIAEAELALANNPGLSRASNLIASVRARKSHTLRKVYIESN